MAIFALAIPNTQSALFKVRAAESPRTQITIIGDDLTPLEQLGRALYFDGNLSKNRNQSCATCHDPAVGYTGGGDAQASRINTREAVYPGNDPELFGNSKPPSAAYAGNSPVLHYDKERRLWIGGMFYDGRATGWELGDPMAEQAKGPFLNPLEMALESPEELRLRVKEGAYVNLFNEVWGEGGIDAEATLVYDQIGESIAAYERYDEVNPHNSKFDYFWGNAQKDGLDVTRINLRNWAKYRGEGLSDNELYGLALFNDPMAAYCASCHSLEPGSQGYPLFTDYSYRNLGLPRNPENPFYANLAYNPEGLAWVETGLGGFLETTQPEGAAREMGKVKVPTLRNVDKRPSPSFVRAYGHNGVFKSLPAILDFYWSKSMSRGMMGMGRMGGFMIFPPPEVNMNLSTLNAFPRRDEFFIYSFLTTLSDSYFTR